MEEEKALKPLRRVIKHKGTGQYYAGTGQWVDAIEKAKDFESVWMMVEEASRYGLTGKCMLMLDFGDKELDVEIDL